MPDDERHGTRKDDDILSDGPYRDGFWQAIAENRNGLILMKTQVTTIENAVMRFERMSDGLSGDMKQIRVICETLNETLIRFDSRITAVEKSIERLWAFPLKIVGVIIALGGAGTVAYRIARWIVTATDVPMRP
jgi:hypothetical protein